MFLFQFIPPPSFSPPLHPSPIYSPLLLSPLAHPIPQTNQFSCLPSILLSMPAPTLSFVLCRDLHFQRPHINLSFMPPSIRPPPQSPLPPPHIVLSRSADHGFSHSFWLSRNFIQDEASVWVSTTVYMFVVWRGVKGIVSIASRLGKAEVFGLGMREWKPPSPYM